MRCDGCRLWTTERVTDYADGSRISNWRAPDGQGQCGHLKILTAADFGCNKFEEWAPGALVPAGRAHVARDWKNGAPWMHWVMGPCADCKGNPGGGGGVCRRCAGTGKVRYYDDGFIGEEQTRLHPREKEHAEPLRCPKCRVEVQVTWVACPMCGNKLEGVAETVEAGFGNQGQTAHRGPARDQFAETLGQDIEEMNRRDAQVVKLRQMTVENGCTPEEAATAAAMADRIEAMGRP